MQKELQMVKDFHLAFGHPTSPIFRNVHIRLAGERADYMREEIKEYLEAVSDDDSVGVADALGDIAYFFFGTVVVHGFEKHFAKIFEIVHKANMSKLCTTIEGAEETVKFYAEGKHPQSLGKKISAAFREVVLSDSKKYWVVFSTENNKVLKSLQFQSPNKEIEEYLKSIPTESLKSV